MNIKTVLEAPVSKRQLSAPVSAPTVQGGSPETQNFDEHLENEMMSSANPNNQAEPNIQTELISQETPPGILLDDSVIPEPSEQQEEVLDWELLCACTVIPVVPKKVVVDAIVDSSTPESTEPQVLIEPVDLKHSRWFLRTQDSEAGQVEKLPDLGSILKTTEKTASGKSEGTVFSQTWELIKGAHAKTQGTELMLQPVETPTVSTSSVSSSTNPEVPVKTEIITRPQVSHALEHVEKVLNQQPIQLPRRLEIRLETPLGAKVQAFFHEVQGQVRVQLSTNQAGVAEWLKGELLQMKQATMNLTAETQVRWLPPQVEGGNQNPLQWQQRQQEQQARREADEKNQTQAESGELFAQMVEELV